MSLTLISDQGGVVVQDEVSRLIVGDGLELDEEAGVSRMRLSGVAPATSFSAQEDGTAAAPAFRRSDVGSGMYFSGSNVLFSVASALLLTLSPGAAAVAGTLSVTDVATFSDRIVGGIGAKSTSGTLDFDDISNSRSGSGHALMNGTATNHPTGGSAFYHTWNFEYSSKTGAGNITQLAIPYGNNTSINNGIFFRGRFSGVWTAWCRVLTTDETGHVTMPLLSLSAAAPAIEASSGSLTLRSVTDVIIGIDSDDSGTTGIFAVRANGAGTNLLSVTETGVTALAGQLHAADGSAAAPGIAFASETALGIYRFAAGAGALSSGGVISLKWYGSGHVSVEATKRIYLDSGIDTYIAEVAADTGSLVAGGIGALQWAPTWVRPGITNTIALGQTDVRWANVFSVLGNFTGAVTLGGAVTFGNESLTRDVNNGRLVLSGGNTTSAGAVYRLHGGTHAVASTHWWLSGSTSLAVLDTTGLFLETGIFTGSGAGLFDVEDAPVLTYVATLAANGDQVDLSVTATSKAGENVSLNWRDDETGQIWHAVASNVATVREWRVSGSTYTAAQWFYNPTTAAWAQKLNNITLTRDNVRRVYVQGLGQESELVTAWIPIALDLAALPWLESISVIWNAALEQLEATAVFGAHCRSILFEFADNISFTLGDSYPEVNGVDGDTVSQAHTVAMVDRGKPWYVRVTPYNAADGGGLAGVAQIAGVMVDVPILKTKSVSNIAFQRRVSSAEVFHDPASSSPESTNVETNLYAPADLPAGVEVVEIRAVLYRETVNDNASASFLRANEGGGAETLGGPVIHSTTGWQTLSDVFSEVIQPDEAYIIAVVLTGVASSGNARVQRVEIDYIQSVITDTL